jgi:hypothetical protein
MDSHIIGLFLVGILVILYAFFIYNSDENMLNLRHKKYLMGSRCNCNEGFCSSCGDSDDSIIPDMYPVPVIPFWNSTRHTRNSSWDIRGDIPITPYYLGPWWQSPLI